MLNPRRSGAPDRGLGGDDPVRFYPVDALRGVAALLVLVFHLFRSPPQTAVLSEIFPEPLQLSIDYSRSGVAIFFVISGFVIGHTARNLGPRLRDGIAFSARRQVRLDPPYYVVMLVVVLISLAERLVDGLVYQTYSPFQFVVNMTYLQDITNTPSVLAVAWTLCFEVQFYLVVVLLTWLAGRVGRTAAARQRLVRSGALLLGAVSLACPFLGVDTGPWFIGPWWSFCLGLTLAWFMHKRLSIGTMCTIMVLVAVWCAAQPALAAHPDPWGGQWFSLMTGVVVMLLVTTGRITSRVPRIWLYFGGISYSLYLVHLPVIDTVLGALFKITGDSRSGALLGFIGAGILSVAAAHVLHRSVEEWAMRMSKRIPVNRHVGGASQSAESPLPTDPASSAGNS